MKEHLHNKYLCMIFRTFAQECLLSYIQPEHRIQNWWRRLEKLTPSYHIDHKVQDRVTLFPDYSLHSQDFIYLPIR